MLRNLVAASHPRAWGYGVGPVLVRCRPDVDTVLINRTGPQVSFLTTPCRKGATKGATIRAGRSISSEDTGSTEIPPPALCRRRVSRSTLHASTPRLLPQPLHHGAHPLDALARVLFGAAAFEGDDAVPALLVQVGHAGADVVGVDAAADINLRAADAGFLAAHGGRQRRADILDVAMADVGAQGFEVIERVVAGDESVPGVEVALQVFGLEVLEEVVHELEVVGVGTMRLDVDDDLVVLGPGEALAVIVAGDAEDFLARHAWRLERAIDGIDHRAAEFGGEADGLRHILHAEGRAVGPHHRVGTINLRDLEAELVREAADGARVGLQGDARIIAQGGDEVLAVDGAELDVLEAGGGDLLAGGFEANAEGPPVNGVYSYLNHAVVLCLTPGNVKAVQERGLTPPP